MTAIVTVPPVLDFYFTPSRASALGARAVVDILQTAGVQAKLLNFPMLGRKPAKLKLPSELLHLKPFIIEREHGPLSFFSTYKRFGPSIEDCARRIIAEEPGLLLISCFAWAYAAETAALAEAVKKLRPEIRIAAGGAGVSVNPEYFNKCTSIDSVLCGEAEKVLPDFLKDVSGIEVAGVSNTDEPAFGICRTGSSKLKNIDYYTAILTRGCPKACRFCSNYLVHGRKFRKTPAEKIKQSIRNLPDDRNIHINFEDDNLLFARDYFLDILRAVRIRFPDATFSAENGLDYTLLDENLIDELISLGFRSFNLSMASTSQELLRDQSREADQRKLSSILNHLGRSGTASVTYFICGLEGESPASVMENLVYLHGLPTLSGISLFYAVPGIPSGGNDLNLFPPRLCAGSSAWPWTGSLTSAQMITAFRLSRLSNLIKTLEGRLPAPSAGGADCSALAEKTISTGRLHTLRGKQIIEVPEMDEAMIHEFISHQNSLRT